MLRNFSGSFRLPNFNFTEELLNLTSNGSPSLTAELENKLDGLFRDSPALGRYFSRSQIYHYSDGPVTALFRLMFRMPEEKEEEEGGQLTHFTLSWEMIYNVLRQFLYDQEVDPSDHTYIEPASLNISSVVTNRKDCHCL
uniref:SEA domain-containing protein n=2 Tax=Periophthalmus magnuspinnatus TaxID=409849 RepID=A0A3B4A3A9_9GOBI